MHIQLNLGKIQDNQGFFDKLWKIAMERRLPLTMSDRDYQNPSGQYQEFKKNEDIGPQGNIPRLR